MALPAPVAPLSVFSVFASGKPVTTALLLLRVRLFTNVVWMRWAAWIRLVVWIGSVIWIGLVVWMGLVVSGVTLVVFGAALVVFGVALAVIALAVIDVFSSGQPANAALLLRVWLLIDFVWVVLVAAVGPGILLLCW